MKWLFLFLMLFACSTNKYFDLYVEEKTENERLRNKIDLIEDVKSETTYVEVPVHIETEPADSQQAGHRFREVEPFFWELLQ